MVQAEENQQSTHGGGVFVTTMWSVVLAAGHRERPDGQQALERLCRTYWRPIYAFLRHNGHSPADAEDLTQGFLASLLARDSLAALAPEQGRFRSFLLASLRHFVADQRDRANALKRGGGQKPISLDAETAEAFYAQQATNGDTPEHSFEKHWAQTIIDRTQQRLATECEAAGKTELYQHLGPEGERTLSHAEIAALHHMTENAVRLAAFRLRQRYQELVRAEIRETVSSDEELEEEIRYLLRVFSGG
jgi:DNA-directed RNA polymerase specialized sigma24 family protein